MDMLTLETCQKNQETPIKNKILINSDVNINFLIQGGLGVSPTHHNNQSIFIKNSI